MADPLLNPNKDPEVLRLKRHPFGIWTLYMSFVFGFAAVIAIIITVLPELDITISASQQSLLFAGLAFGGAIGFLFLLVARYIYWQSEMCVTDSAVTEVVQYGLFSRHVARLDMEKIEDVTARQKGIFPTMLNYGTLLIETAGEVDNFVFPYCPNPNEAARKIHEARQDYLERRMQENAQVHAATMNNQSYSMPPQQPMPQSVPQGVQPMPHAAPPQASGDWQQPPQTPTPPSPPASNQY